MKQSGARRENGAGNIYEREPGKWVGRLRIGVKADGKPAVKYFSGKSEAEVKRKIREYNRANDPESAKKITVAQYMTNWMTTFKRPSLKKTSYDRLEKTFNTHIVPSIGMIQLGELKADDVQRLISHMQSSGLGHSSIKKVYDCMNDAMRFAVAKDDIVKNPMLLVKMPEKSQFPQKEIRYFTPLEVSLISEEVQRRYSTGRPVYVYGDVYMLMLNTGIRVGELVGLKREDWNKEEGVLHVQRTAQLVVARDATGQPVGGHQLLLSTTKTYSGDRYIPLNKNATVALQRLCETRMNSDFVVSDKKGNNVSPRQVERAFERVIERLGIPKAGTHSLRHTFASMLFANGVDVKTVSKLLGHASIQITLNTYIHMIDKADHKAVIKLDDIF